MGILFGSLGPRPFARGHQSRRHGGQQRPRTMLGALGPLPLTGTDLRTASSSRAGRSFGTARRPAGRDPRDRRSWKDGVTPHHRGRASGGSSHRASRASHADRPMQDDRRSIRRRSAPEVREPPEGRGLQGPRAMNAVLQLDDSTARERRGDALLGQPRPGPRVGGRDSRHPREHRDAGQRPRRQATRRRGIRSRRPRLRTDAGIASRRASGWPRTRVDRSSPPTTTIASSPGRARWRSSCSDRSPISRP